MNFRNLFRNIGRGIGELAKATIFSKLFEEKRKLHQEFDQVETKYNLPPEAMASIRNKLNKGFDKLVEQINEI